MQEESTVTLVKFIPRSEVASDHDILCSCCRCAATWVVRCVPANIGCCELQGCRDYAAKQAVEVAHIIARYKEREEIESVGKIILFAPLRPTLPWWRVLGNTLQNYLMMRIERRAR